MNCPKCKLDRAFHKPVKGQFFLYCDNCKDWVHEGKTPPTRGTAITKICYDGKTTPTVKDFLPVQTEVAEPRRIELTLPYPPPSNQKTRMNRKTGTLYTAGEFLDYDATVARICKDQKIVPLKGRVSVRAIAYMPYPEKSDMPNIWKNLYDAMNGCTWSDDRKIFHEEHTRKYDGKANARIELIIEEIQETK